MPFLDFEVLFFGTAIGSSRLPALAGVSQKLRQSREGTGRYTLVTGAGVPVPVAAAHGAQAPTALVAPGLDGPAEGEELQDDRLELDRLPRVARELRVLRIELDRSLFESRVERSGLEEKLERLPDLVPVGLEATTTDELDLTAHLSTQEEPPPEAVRLKGDPHRAPEGDLWLAESLARVRPPGRLGLEEKVARGLLDAFDLETQSAHGSIHPSSREPAPAGLGGAVGVADRESYGILRGCD